MWRHHVRRAGRHLWRLVLLTLLLVLLFCGTLLAMLGSETGSRWLLEQGLGMQQMLGARYQHGTLLGGLELTDVHVRLAKVDIRVRHLLARWSLWQLFRGDVRVASLELQGVDIHKLTPPGPDSDVLPTVLLPVHLTLERGHATDLNYWPWQATQPYALRQLDLAGADWRATKLRVRQVVAVHDRIGRLELGGRLRLSGGYPIEATGRLDYLAFREKGWLPVEFDLAHEVVDLDLKLRSRGGLTAQAQGRIKPLRHDMPYEAFLQWGKVVIPWWSDQSLSSQGGHLKVLGTRAGLNGQGEAQLDGHYLPPGRYTWKGRSDWRGIHFEPLYFSGLGGKAQVTGDLGWHAGLDWKLLSRLDGIDLAKKWPVPRVVAPVLTGELKTSGNTSGRDSAVGASLRLTGGEAWDVSQTGRSWFWNFAVPQQVSARWAHVQRRLPDGQVLSSESGQLEGSGARQDYRARLQTQLAGTRLPSGQWASDFTGVGRQLQVRQLTYQGDAGQLAFQGRMTVGDPLGWSGQFALTNFASDWLLPDWPGRFSGELAGAGSWGSARREFHLEQMQLAGQLRQQALTLDGPLDVELQPGNWPQLRSAGLHTSWGRNQAVLIGGLMDHHWDLSAQLDLGDLAQLRPDLQGHLYGQLALQGREREPDVQAVLAGERIGTRGWIAQTASLQASVQALGNGGSQLSLDAGGLTNGADADWGHVHLDLNGTRDRHTLQWRAESERFTGQGSLAGSLAGLDWSGRMETGQVTITDLQWQLSAPYALAWRQGARQLRLDPHCWVSGEARLCNEDTALLGTAGHVRASLQGLRLERLASLMPEGLVVTGLATGSAVGEWRPGEAPALHAELQSEKGEFRLAREQGGAPLVRGYDRIALRADADTRTVDLRLDLQSPDMGQGRVQARINPYGAGKPLQGELALQGLHLEIFQPFFPSISTLAGTISAQGRLGGVLAKPDFQGVVQLQEGELALQQSPVHVRNVDGRIDVHGTSADITGSMHSGEGSASLSGSADWSGQPRLNLALKGERFQLRQPPELLADIDPDLELHMVPRRVDLTGSIRVPMARLNLKPLTDKAVPLSPDVRISSDRERVQAVGQVADWDINADIRLLLGDDVYFHGYGVNGRLLGSLRLRQEGKRGLEANGEVELDKDARYDAYGQRLQIRRGRLIFAGNLSQPGLDVEAIREIDNKVVGVRVQGRANAPEATLFSDQSMSQEEMVSYLVLGRPLDASGRPEAGTANLTAAAAAIKLGSAGGAGLTSRVGETLGISDLAVDAEGSGEDTQFTVSGYISPKLYLRYGVGIFTPVNTATLRYKINSKLYLEAMSSLESAIDLFYNMRF